MYNIMSVLDQRLDGSGVEMFNQEDKPLCSLYVSEQKLIKRASKEFGLDSRQVNSLFKVLPYFNTKEKHSIAAILPITEVLKLTPKSIDLLVLYKELLLDDMLNN